MQAHDAAELAVAAARAAVAAVAEAPAAGAGREAAERAVLEAVKAAAAAAAAERDPAAEDCADVGVESQASRGSYEAARERASSMAAAATEDFQRKREEAQAQGHETEEL